MPSTRRTFLSLLGLGAVASAFDPDVRAMERDDHLDAPADPQWDLSWTRRVRGKSRAVFDVAAMIGDPTARAAMWRDQYAQVFRIPIDKLTPVVVVRHLGIDQVMDDDYWRTFNPARRGGRGAAADSTAAPHGNSATPAITSFLAKGGIVLACNLAFGNVIASYRERGHEGDDATKEARSHLIPGVILQPSGPFALMRAQDEGCHYMMAS